MPEAPAPGPEARIDLVDTTLDASRPVSPGLVAHRVGEELDGVVTGDAVAVEVEEGVELGQAEATVPPKEREARGA